MDLNLIERIKMMDQLTPEVIASLPEILSPLETRWRRALSREDAQELTGFPVETVGAVRYMAPSNIKTEIDNNDDIRVPIVGIPFPVNGGWVLAGNDHTIFAFMNDSITSQRCDFYRGEVTDGELKLIYMELDADEVLEGHEYCVTCVNSYAPGGQVAAQKFYDEHQTYGTLVYGST